MADRADEDKGPAVIIVCALFQAFATVFVFARFFCRIRLLDRLYLDDWILMLALCCGWTAVGMTVASVHYGDGRHMDTLTPDQMSQVLLWTIAGFFPGIMAFTLPKLAVISLLCRMLSPSRKQQIFMFGLGTLLLINAFVCLGMLFGRCRPFRAVWDVTIPDDQKVCWDFWHIVCYAIFTTAVSLLADLYLAVYPALVLRKLQMSLKKKIALSAALGVGGISVIVTAYKCTRLTSMTSPDFSFDTADLTVWTIVEGSVVTIAATIPVLKPLVDLIFGQGALGGSSYRRNAEYLSDTPGNGRGASDIEFGSRNVKGPTTTNIIKSIVGDENESEESLVRARAEGKLGSSSVALRNIHSRGDPTNGIVQIHEVTIAYGTVSAEGQAQRKRDSWA
ncbi:integral membrane protein [Staphylotrichum tortipilum]|uniref:Integral membrane protein n=1 Tax=Staphylotrichum tortipilum TaxID=2831512 RepID=A0AAN6MC87_9PEZI|nr:integral membrane protein [Staphylotrichum longicolle]